MLSTGLSKMKCTVVLLALALIIHGSDGRRVGTEQRLYGDLFQSYNPESRPVENASKPVIVSFGIALNQLLDLDEKNQVLTTAVWVHEEWTDENLRWDPEDYDGLDTLMIPSTNVWVPDMFLFNKAGDNADGFVNVTGSKVKIGNDGLVKWMVPIMVKSSCVVDVTYFPYDDQKCHLRFGSWIYDVTQVDMRLNADRPDLSHYVQNSEYDLTAVSVSRSLVDSNCCPGDGSHAMVDCHISVKRKSLYYDYIVIAPTIMLCILTLVSFLLPCHKGEKINIGLTVFLTLYVLQLLIAENVPDTNSTPVLGIFLFMVMTFNCVSLIMATLVMNIKKRGEDKQSPAIPKWLFWLCRVVLSKIVLTKYAWEQPASCDQFEFQPDPSSKIEVTLNGGQPSENILQPADETDQSPDEATCTTELLPSRPTNELLFPRSRSDRKICTDGHIEAMNRGAIGEVGRTRKPDGRFSVTSVQYHSIQIKRQWFFVAEVVDKFLFLIYLISMTISIGMILVIIPSYKLYS
ncbi:neuronal acetylcholine receptor subunit alpha-5-like [Haliotis rubra]|uniref:neuronal acetylcholine receptor subunit alpha-5-like n=1 Tax=Haliotis rubra TaxID=36100 RepID=UPI001EE5A647|nr:neuronal acetylcholine receptor subunit alpha-5-like [Haliotis rubra]